MYIDAAWNRHRRRTRCDHPCRRESIIPASATCCERQRMRIQFAFYPREQVLCDVVVLILVGATGCDSMPGQLGTTHFRQ